MNDGSIIYDITVPLTPETLIYPDDPPFARHWQQRLDQGDTAALSYFQMGSHNGTHLDAPAHFFAMGATLDQIALEVFLGPAYVADCRGLAAIDAQALRQRLPSSCDRLLIKTDNSALVTTTPFHPDHAYLCPDAAAILVERHLKLVGFDYLSIDASSDTTAPCHLILLGHGMVILETINLSQVPEGWYELFCQPLAIATAEAAPCRALLRKITPAAL